MRCQRQKSWMRLAAKIVRASVHFSDRSLLAHEIIATVLGSASMTPIRVSKSTGSEGRVVVMFRLESRQAVDWV